MELEIYYIVIKYMSKLLSPHLKKIIKINPFDNEEYLFDYNNPINEWNPLFNKMIKYYDKILIKKKNKLYLPKGTILYHGSLDFPLILDTNKYKKNNLTFFGLDSFISIWYILELMLSKNINQNFGYLYSFTLKKDLEIILNKEYYELINKNINPECLDKPCLHPHVIFRGTMTKSPKIYNISSELILNYNKYKKNILLKNIYIIDPKILFKNRNDPKWDPRKAIIKRYNKLNTAEKDLI